MPRKKVSPVKSNLSPYLALLDNEVGAHRREPPARTVGRPRKAFTRKHVNLTLTDDELSWLDDCIRLLENHLAGNISRGILVAFMSARLHAALMSMRNEDGSPALPDTVTSLETLSDYLDEIGS